MGHDLAPILVTGAAGYLGGEVVARLRARGIPCAATSRSGAAGSACDLTDHAAVCALLAEAGPSAVIHCAALVPKSASCYDDAAAAEASLAMVDLLAKEAPCPVIFASSMTVYAACRDFPAHEERPQPPEAGYGHGKWLAEQRLFARRFPGDVALRLPGLFGAPRRAGLLYNAARSFLLAGTFEISPGSGIWAAMSVGDAAEYLVRAALARAGAPPQAVNVGYPGSFEVAAAVAEIAALCGVEWQPSAGGTHFSMSLQRLEARYGMLPVTFRQRLEELVHSVGQELAEERMGDDHAG